MKISSVASYSLLLLGVAFANANAETQMDDSVECRPREVVLPVDPKHHRYYPFFTKVYRCSGGCDLISPKVHMCTPISSEEVHVRVVDMADGSQIIKRKMLNHTRCTCACATSAAECNPLQKFNDGECRCVCNLKSPPKDQPCKPGFVWDPYMCKCKCDTPPTVCGDPQIRLWSDEVCGCTCTQRVVKRCARKKKDLDLKTCSCVDMKALKGARTDDENKSRMYITFLVLMAFIIIILVCVLVHFIRKSRRTTRGYISEDPLSPTPISVTPKPVLSRSDSGNISSCSHNSLSDIRKSSNPDKGPNHDPSGTPNGIIGIESTVCTLERESKL